MQQKAMDEKDVPETERVAIVKPEEYYKLVQDYQRD